MSSTYEKANEGAYKSKLDFGVRAQEPAVLRRMARDLTADELHDMANVKAEYERAKAEQKAKEAAYHKDEGRLMGDFRKDLETEHGMTGHPKADKLYGLAWDYGHSAGLAEVAIHYDAFVELVDVSSKVR